MLSISSALNAVFNQCDQQTQHHHRHHHDCEHHHHRHHDCEHHHHLLLLLQTPFPLCPKPRQAAGWTAEAEQFTKGPGDYDDAVDDDDYDIDEDDDIDVDDVVDNDVPSGLYRPSKLSAAASVDHRVHAGVDPAKPSQHLWIDHHHHHKPHQHHSRHHYHHHHCQQHFHHHHHKHCVNPAKPSQHLCVNHHDH